MKTFSITLDIIRACATAMSSEETRYYLRGIHVVSGGSGAPLFVEATDGHRMIRARIAAHNAASSDVIDAIIPDTLVKALTKVKPLKGLGLQDHPIAFETEGNKVTATDPATGASWTHNLVDGAFPDTSRIIPDSVSGDAAQFNAAYLADMAKASKVLGNKDGLFSIAYNGENVSPIMFPERDDVCGILMPLRTPKMAYTWSNVAFNMRA